MWVRQCHGMLGYGSDSVIAYHGIADSVVESCDVDQSHSVVA